MSFVRSVLQPTKSARLFVRRLYSTRAYADFTGIHYDANTPMWKAQSKVPRLPIPDLKTTCDRYLEQVAPLITPAEFKQTQQYVTDFLNGEGKNLHEELKRLDAESPTSWLEGFWDTMYLEIRDSSMIYVSPFLMLQNDPRRQTQTGRAANLASGWLRFYDKIRNETVEPDFEKDIPLDMGQYTRLFGTAKIPVTRRDKLVTVYDSKHIVVISHDQFYTVDVIRDNGELIGEAELEANLHNIVEQSARTARPAPGVGILTTENRDKWAALRSELISDPQNARSIEQIDRGLFVLSLDPATPTSLQHASELLLHRDGTNRWFDKLMLVVFKDGQTGTILEHSPIDGHTGLRLMADTTEYALKGPVVEPARSSPLTVRPLTFNVSPSVAQGIEAARKNVEAMVSFTQSKVLEFNRFGSKFIKNSGFSPDSFIQMMFQLAYFRLYGKAESTYESAMTKRFLAGRTETIRSVTKESVEFTKLWDAPGVADAKRLESLKLATEAHAKVAKVAKAGQGVDRHLFGMKNLALHKQQRLARYEYPAIFQDPSYTSFASNILSTSNVSAPFFSLFGFGAVHARGLGLAYNINADTLVFDVTSYTGQAAKFAEALEKAFADVQKVIESNKKSA